MTPYMECELGSPLWGVKAASYKPTLKLQNDVYSDNINNIYFIAKINKPGWSVDLDGQ